MYDTSTIPRETRTAPHQRLAQYKSRHLFAIFQHLELNVRRSPLFGCYSADNSPDWFATYIPQHYSAEEIDAANAAVVATYKNGKGFYRKGRPMGSRNRRTVERETCPDTQFETTAAVLPTTHEQTALPTVRHEQQSDLEAKIAAIARDILDDRKKNTEDHNAIYSNLRVFNDRVEVVERTTDRLWETVNTLKEHRPTLIEIKRPELPNVKMGVQHKHFAELLAMCSARMRNGNGLNVWIHGPAGTGKSTAAEKVAEALGLEFYCTGSLSAPHEVLGFNNAYKYVSTCFRDAWEHGGVYCLDEADGSSPQAMLALNGALAGSICAFPDKMVRRHKDCIIIATANTTGMGATVEYSGRFKQDAANMNRFVMLDWPIDEGLEASMCGNDAWLKRVRQVRANVAKHAIKGVMITSRAVLHGEALLASGLSQDRVERSVLQGAMTDAQWAMVR